MTYTNVFSQIPNKITAGNSVSWSVSLPGYLASSGWVLTYTLVNAGAKIEITASADGDNHLVEVPIADSVNYLPGKYFYQTNVSNGTERYSVGSGQVEILPDFATKATHDNRDWLDIAIDALEASIAGRASKTQLLQSITGVQIQHMPIAEQLAALRELKKIRSIKRKGSPFKRVVGVRF
jgi:hypothetical protein